MKKSLLWLVVLIGISLSAYRLYRVYREFTIQELIEYEQEKLRNQSHNP